MVELEVISGFLGGGVLVGFCVYIYLQKKISHVRQDIALYQERARRLEDVDALLSKREDELRLQGERNAELRVALQRTEKESADKLSLLENIQKQWEDKFKVISQDTLSMTNKSFLELANATLEKFQEVAQNDLSNRQQAISDLVKPVTESLQTVDQKIIELEKSRMSAYAVLKHQVSELLSSQNQLKTETSNLVNALRAPSVRGRWGEMQLRRVVEMAGMVKYCDFEEQVSSSDQESRLRPDLIINLPGGKKIIVDAKAPLAAYLEALEAKDEETRLEKLKDHARQVRSHIKALAKRSYYEQFQPAPEFVVLFLPGETFFSAALEQDPSLIEAGVEDRIILATPTTLIALLRAVAYGWRHEHLAENAKEISELGRELHKRLSDMADHFARLGRNLGGAVQSYNQAMGSLEHRVLVSARKFKELGSVSEASEIVLLDALDHIPRERQAHELPKVG
ncbi:MAG TPA: DNA recombination protein RmuC [Alphaproteobacteria bacterium]|nr:DNA recombination protein RmuC [Alphaproteobacteria bacterium]